jgi:hypothetical protein
VHGGHLRPPGPVPPGGEAEVYPELRRRDEGSG